MFFISDCLSRRVLPGLLFAGLALPASAAVFVYSGADPGVGAGQARPNSDAARTAFATSVGSTTLINFENAPLGNFSSLGIAPGVTVNLNGLSVNGLDTALEPGITTLDGHQSSPSQDYHGFNTTAGGSRYLRIVPVFSTDPASVVFTFDNPIHLFGAYLTDTQTTRDGSITLTFNDGTSQSFAIGKNDGSGGVQFFGIRTDQAGISSITFAIGPRGAPDPRVPGNPSGATRDLWGIDDVEFASVPEPSTWFLFVTGAVLVALRRRK